MSDLPSDFDLQIKPDWLKEEPAKNPYANYEGPRDSDRERPRRDGDFRDRRPGPPRGERSGPKPRDERRGSPGPQRRDTRGRPPQREDRPHFTPPQPAKVNVEFLPEPDFITSLGKQIKASGRAWPLFGLAKLFLEKPERHRVRITSPDAAVLLWQSGENGPVTLDRALAEKTAFAELRPQFYAEEVTQRDAPKGNFSNVARCRLSGVLLGPTSHHGYQPALRKLYEERFSRRMPFPEYLREIETISDPAAIEAWKESARSVRVFKTTGEGEPVTFQTVEEMEQHFRTHHLEAAVRSGSTFELSGEASRRLRDRGIALAVKLGWEQQRGFPGGMMHHIRRELSGLHVIKHRKRMQFITDLWPVPLKDEGLSDTISAILKAIDAAPGGTRGELAAKILGESPTDVAKAALAGDLHWLIRAGHVIEFHDGRLDLPLIRVASPERKGPVEEPALSETTKTTEATPLAETPAPVSAEQSPMPQEQ